uniref:Exoribonuclease phosphorolytic domain-containing protein n=1 Tax=Plectus sambesii TaxID=2011161 RepID=A0A914WPC5_9BILA
MRLPASSLPLSHFTQSSSGLPSHSDRQNTANMRPFFIRANVLESAKGSAYIEMGNTKLVCSVDGPKEITVSSDSGDAYSEGILNVRVKFAVFSHQERTVSDADAHRRIGDPTELETKLAANIQDGLSPAVCLDRIPRAQIDINCTILEDQGGVLSAALICASSALADAGIDMYDLVLSSSLAVVDNDQMIVDPSTTCLADKPISGSVTVALMPSLNQVVTCEQSGACSPETLRKAIRLATECCVKLHPLVQKALVTSVRLRSRPK